MTTTTKTIEHTNDNCQQLASDIVEAWDLDSLIEFAVCTLEDRFQNDTEAFWREWQDFYTPQD